MPPALQIDLSKIDLESDPIYNKKQIEKVNPQAYEMQQLDGILWYDQEKRLILGYKDVTEDEFWVRGHIPGRPLMPGVIMIECAAQLLSFYVKEILELDAFIGFSGIESATFRLPVTPGQRLLLLGNLYKIRSRKYYAYVQGVVDGKFVFDASVSGMKV